MKNLDEIKYALFRCRKCGWKSNPVDSIDLPDYINKECPKCSSKSLTNYTIRNNNNNFNAENIKNYGEEETVKAVTELYDFLLDD